MRYKGKGEHSVNQLEQIIEERENELHLLRTEKTYSQEQVLEILTNFAPHIRYNSKEHLGLMWSEIAKDWFEQKGY